jgi:hypothetical protein
VPSLNLRERAIETTIAYVGAPRAGRATNFERLQTTAHARSSTVSPNDVRCLEWRPSELGDLGGVELAVRLVASDRNDVLADADGVVLVVDSDPSALQRNLAAAEALRAALGGRELPVVVQLNKRDLREALGEETLISSLGLSPWPTVAASAARGEGIVETVDRAIEGVLEMIQQTNGAASRVVAPRPTEENPLLLALQSILEEAIRTQIAGLEARVVDRLAGRAGELDELRAQIAGLRGEVTALARRDVPDHGPTLAQLRVASERTASRDDLQKLAATIAAGQRAVEGSIVEGRKQDQQNAGKVLGALAEAQGTTTGAIAALAADVTKIVGRAEAIEPRLTKAFEERSQRALGSLESRLDAMITVRVAGALSEIEKKILRVDEKIATFATHFDEFVEELKKRKRGWFG